MIQRVMFGLPAARVLLGFGRQIRCAHCDDPINIEQLSDRPCRYQREYGQLYILADDEPLTAYQAQEAARAEPENLEPQYYGSGWYLMRRGADPTTLAECLNRAGERGTDRLEVRRRAWPAEEGNLILVAGGQIQASSLADRGGLTADDLVACDWYEASEPTADGILADALRRATRQAEYSIGPGSYHGAGRRPYVLHALAAAAGLSSKETAALERIWAGEGDLATWRKGCG